MTKPTGGQAFPIVTTYYDEYGTQRSEITNGMTLRDYLVGQVIAGNQIHGKMNDETLAKFAYEIADALIAERTKQ